MSAPPGYYRDPHQPTVERRWNGTHWTREARRAKDDSAPLPTGLPLPPAAPKGAPLRTFGLFLMILAGVVALAAVMGGIGLMGHTACTSNFCDNGGQAHPDVGFGLAVLFGGLLQAALLAGVGLLCRELNDLRGGSSTDA